MSTQLIQSPGELLIDELKNTPVSEAVRVAVERQLPVWEVYAARTGDVLVFINRAGHSTVGHVADIHKCADILVNALGDETFERIAKVRCERKAPVVIIIDMETEQLLVWVYGEVRT